MPDYFNGQLVTAMRAAAMGSTGTYTYLEQAIEIQKKGLKGVGGGVCVGLTTLFLSYASAGAMIKDHKSKPVIWTLARDLQLMYEKGGTDDVQLEKYVDAQKGLTDVWAKMGFRYLGNACSMKSKELKDIRNFIAGQDGFYHIITNSDEDGKHAIAAYVKGNDCRLFDPNSGMVHVSSKTGLKTAFDGYFTHPIVQYNYVLHNKDHLVECYRLGKL